MTGRHRYGYTVRKAPAVDKSDFLIHYGISGQKWHVRRYQDESGRLTAEGRERYGIDGTRSARGIARDLNRVDRKITKAQSNADYYRTKFERSYSKKEYRANKRGENAPEKSRREKRLEAKAKHYQELVDTGKAFTNNVIKNANARGMSIRSKDVKRQVNAGRNFLFNLVSQNTTGIGRVDRAVGTSYKVKNDGKGTSAHRTKYDRNMKERNYIAYIPDERRRSRS